MSITRVSRYYKTRYRTFVIRLSYDKDRDLVEQLEKVDNVTDYIRSLLKKENLNNEKRMNMVEVVRCKDCEHRYYADNRIKEQRCYVCGFTGFEDVEDDHFCSYGKRKGD